MSQLTMESAGLRPDAYYRSNMSPVRYQIRSFLESSIKSETALVQKVQLLTHNRILDWYFALTANFGTHTMYLVGLPCLIWAGCPDLGIDLIWVLAGGVYLTGLIKDYVCLPRPMSPPVKRISMSHSAMLEYGFPSTHSCNAISVALVLAARIESPLGYTVNWILTLSILVGRIYTGMHGPLDVLAGTLMGYIVYLARVCTGDFVDGNLMGDTPNVHGLAVLALAVVALVCYHPKILDECPCFDDSVAFLSVVLGIYMGNFAMSLPSASYSFRDAEDLTWGYILARILCGTPVLIAWKVLSKPVINAIMVKLMPRGDSAVMATKVVVYSGISGFCVSICMLLFYYLGI